MLPLPCDPLPLIGNQNCTRLKHGGYKIRRSVPRMQWSLLPLLVIDPALMVHDMTPPLSPTSSIGSTNSSTTPIDARTPTLVDNLTMPGERAFEGRFALFKNSSEVWEEFKDVGSDSCSVTVADPEILISPSSSLLSGLDLLGDATSPPLPEATAAPTRSRSHQTVDNETILDFPSPPAFVLARGTSVWESPLIGKGSLTASPLSHPGLALSCDSIPQPTHYPQFSTLRRCWSTLPPAESYPNNRRRSSERVSTNDTDTFWAGAAVTNTDTPVVPRGPFPTASHHGPGDGLLEPSRRRPKQQEPDPFESFIDMSVTESTLSTSRVHKLFSKILKSRGKRRH